MCWALWQTFGTENEETIFKQFRTPVEETDIKVVTTKDQKHSVL